MRVLVTGGAGFIGSNLTRALVDRGDEVFVLDNLSLDGGLSRLEGLLDRVRFVHGDVRHLDDLAALPPGGFDRIFHLAASFANERSLVHPGQDLQTNAQGTLNVIELARRVGCGLLVYAGSSSSYGHVPVPFGEDDPIAPSTPYALTKLLGERYVEASGLPFAIFRLFNVYGPGDPPGPFRNAIPNMMRALDEPGGKVRVFGEGSTRDFTFVDDAVRVLCEADLARGATLNVGTGVETSIVALARAIVALFGLDEGRIELLPPRPWDKVSRRVADPSALLARMPWACPTRLDRGLALTAAWLLRLGHLARRP